MRHSDCASFRSAFGQAAAREVTKETKESRIILNNYLQGITVKETIYIKASITLNTFLTTNQHIYREKQHNFTR